MSILIMYGAWDTGYLCVFQTKFTFVWCVFVEI